MKRIILLAILVATIVYAGPPRLIERSWNINDTFDQRDAVEWWKGESVSLTYTLTSNGTAEDLSGLTLLWHITERDVASNIYLVVTGEVDAATGDVSFELSASNSRLEEDERYDGYIRTYDVSNLMLRVDVVQSITAHDSPYMGDYEPLGPLQSQEEDPIFSTAYAAGLDLSTMTNPPAEWTESAGAGVTNLISSDASVAISGTTAQPDLSITGWVSGVLFDYATLTDLGVYVPYGGELNYGAGDTLPAVDLSAGTNANASAMFGSGTIPTTYLPEAALQAGQVSYYPAETNVVSGAWVLDLRTNAYQAVQLSSNVTSWTVTVADTNALVPWRVDVYGADTNTLTISTNWTVYGDAGSTWTNPAMSILGVAWRGVVSVGKELYQ